jgi:hypothetical protein
MNTSETYSVDIETKMTAMIDFIDRADDSPILSKWRDAYGTVCHLVVCWGWGYINEISDKGVDDINVAFGHLAEILGSTEELLVEIGLTEK